MSESNPKQLVRELISKFISYQPKRISLKLDWNDKHSEINLKGDQLDEVIKYPQTIDFMSYARGIVDAYREVFGELHVTPYSFREEIYRNNKVSLSLYPTGSAGIFDIEIEYK